jgi:carboxyl-terminal processing protease
MSKWLALVAVLMQTAVVTAAPLPATLSPKPASPPDASRYEAIFARQLLDACTQVAIYYVRPVSRVQLIKTALAGLYESARLPMPAQLPAEVDRAATDQQLLELIGRVREEVGYAEPLGSRNAMVICCQVVARSLDPYTVVVTGEEQRRTLGLEQETFGVGLEVAEHQGGPFAVVKTVHPGSPAQRAGLRPDDRLTHLNGRPIRELTDDVIFQKLNPNPFTMDPLVALAPSPDKVVLTYDRPGRACTTTLSLRPEHFQVEYVLGVSREDNQSWKYLVDAHKGLVHIRLASLGRGSEQELSDVLTRLREDGMRGLILDLRWCPGGYLDPAVEVASLFLRDGVIATVDMRVPDRGKDPVHRCQKPGPFADLPLVVLVNGDTSGGAELIAAALQDHQRAVIVGQRTRGKASVQTPVHLNVNQMGMRLTSGTFLRPSGKNLHRFADSKDSDDWGVRPNASLDCRVSAELSQSLRQWWLLQTLRPGGSVERLPLDDPMADPQQQAALEALREIMEQKAAQAE